MTKPVDGNDSLRNKDVFFVNKEKNKYKDERTARLVDVVLKIHPDLAQKITEHKWAKTRHALNSAREIKSLKSEKILKLLEEIYNKSKFEKSSNLVEEGKKTEFEAEKMENQKLSEVERQEVFEGLSQEEQQEINDFIRDVDDFLENFLEKEHLFEKELKELDSSDSSIIEAENLENEIEDQEEIQTMYSKFLSYAEVEMFLQGNPEKLAMEIVLRTILENFRKAREQREDDQRVDKLKEKDELFDEKQREENFEENLIQDSQIRALLSEFALADYLIEEVVKRLSPEKEQKKEISIKEVEKLQRAVSRIVERFLHKDAVRPGETLTDLPTSTDKY